MKWTSPVRRRRLDGVGEPMEVVLDDELLQTPPPRPRAPSRTKKSSEETEDLTDEALSSAEDPASATGSSPPVEGYRALSYGVIQ